MGKPKGWMDVEHTTVSADDAQTIQDLKLLTTSQRRLIEAQITEFVRLNGTPQPPSPGDQDNPGQRPH